MNNKKQYFLKLKQIMVAVFLIPFLFGCPSPDLEQNDNNENIVVEGDSDGDRLSDPEEISRGSSPVLFDTDGDGFSDFDEFVTLQFDGTNSNDPHRFNPLIADMPKIKIRVTSTPEIGLSFAQATTLGNTVFTDRTTETSPLLPSNGTQLESTSIEISNVDRDLPGHPFLLNPSTALPLGYDFTQVSTKADLRTWSEAQILENRAMLKKAQEISRLEEVAITSGSVRYQVEVVNDGNIPFILKDLTLTLLSADPTEPSGFKEMGQLHMDASTFPLPGTVLPSSETSSSFEVGNDSLDANIVASFLLHSKGFVTKVHSYEVQDEDGRLYTHEDATVAAQTALVLIDNGATQERYLVATQADPERTGISAGEAMEKVLQIPYETLSGRLSSVKTIRQDLPNNACWIVIHVTQEGQNEVVTTYTRNSNYDFDRLNLKARETLRLVYLSDWDNDKLFLREELYHGSHPHREDSDGDGLTDLEETVEGWINGFNMKKVTSSPLSVDTDGDRLSDLEEEKASTDPGNKDTDGDGIDDFTEVMILESDPLK